MISIMTGLRPDQHPESWEFQEFTNGCSGGKSIGESERKFRFEQLYEIGRLYGITVAPCRCKNPGLADESCHIAGSSIAADRPTVVQLSLPFQAGHPKGDP
jgi:hypothetical protein